MPSEESEDVLDTVELELLLEVELLVEVDDSSTSDWVGFILLLLLLRRLPLLLLVLEYLQ